MRCKTYAFDNCRFFADKSQLGTESGAEGWVRITAKGRRDFLSGIDPDRSCLVVVDLQAGCVREWPRAIARHDAGLGHVFAQRMEDIVIPNTVALLDHFREKGMLVVYLALGQGEIIPEIAPRFDGSDVLVRKYSSGAFATSTLDNVLREHGIATTFFVGTDTCGCVAATMSGAYDRGYQTILIEDACCSSRPELHDATVQIWAYKGFVRTAAQVIADYPWQVWVMADVRDEQTVTPTQNEWIL